MVVCSREANTVSMECEELPPQKHVLDEWTYRKLLRDRTEGSMGLASNPFTHKEQRCPPGASYGFYPSCYGPPSDSDVSFQSNCSSAPQSSISSGMFRSPKASLMAGSMDRYERFECGELPQGGDGRQHFYHNNGYDEGKQHLLSRGERSEAHYTSQLSSYNQNASYTALSQNGPQDGQDKMVFHNDSALLQKLSHTSQHTHVYSQPPNSKSRMDTTTKNPSAMLTAYRNQDNGAVNHDINIIRGQSLQPSSLDQAPLDMKTNPSLKEHPLSMRNAHLNQENGEFNYNIGLIHGQSVSVSHPTSLNHDIQTKQLTRGNPLSLRNDHLNQQNDMVNESVSAIQEQPMSHTSSFQEISLPSQRGHLSQQNGNMGSHSSQRIVMEVSQCTSLGQAPSGTELRQSQKTRNPMSIRNDRLNQENTFNQGVPPHVVKVPTPVPGYHISLYRDQGDQEPGHVPSATHSQPISDPSQKVNAYGGKSNQGPEDIPFHKHNHEISQGFSHRNMPPDASGQMHKKVFILHFTNTEHSLETNPVLKLATCLRRMDVNVTLDLFEYDNRIDNWLVWYERKINESDVVLCIITENFYDQLTNGNHVLGNSVYNLMNQSRNIAFLAVFIDADKREMMEHVPPAMRGATSYSLSSNRLTPNDDEFANLYAFLTGQNRVKKPELGNMIILAPKTSRCKLHVQSD